MLFEIVSVEEGENPDDLLVEVAYWHVDANKGKKPADYVEHHYVRQIPDAPVARMNDLGQYMLKSGIPHLTPYVEVAGHWERRVATPETDPDIDWIYPDAVEMEERILRPIRGRAEKIKKDKTKGEDKFSNEDKPRPGRRPRGVKSMAKRNEFTSLVGRTEKI